MFVLETWFIFALLSALVAGIGAFGNKIAASRKYDTQLVVILNALTAIFIFGPLALWFESASFLTPEIFLILLVTGAVMSFGIFIKIQVLHYIDSAIFLPLYKVLGPMIVLLTGIVFFSETFSAQEWLGIGLSLLVPLILVSRAENTRQNNLKIGLLLVALVAFVSALVAGLHKFSAELTNFPLWIITINALGIFATSSLQYLLKHKASTLEVLKSHYSNRLLSVALMRTVFSYGGSLLVLYSFVAGGPLGIVYMINSLYILPPIILAVIFYKEHWNLRKVTAIGLSLLALALLH